MASGQIRSVSLCFNAAKDENELYTGRKTILFASIATFLVGFSHAFTFIAFLCEFFSQIGSALCGVAHTMTWLIVGCAVQGLGGGGVTQMVIIVVSDIIPLEEYVSIVQPAHLKLMLCRRGTYSGCLGATVGISRYELHFLAAYWNVMNPFQYCWASSWWRK